MSHLAKLRKIREIHDRRQQVAAARLNHSRSAYSKTLNEEDMLNLQILEVDQVLKSSVNRLLESTSDPDHYRSLATNLSVRKLKHQEARIMLDHQKMQNNERKEITRIEVIHSEQLLAQVLGKQKKFGWLVDEEEKFERETDDLREEDDVSDSQIYSKGNAGVR